MTALQRVVVGVNAFQEGSDARAAEEARRRLADAYRRKVNLVPPMMAAVQAYLSIGEIARPRQEALGKPAFAGPLYFGR